MFEATSVDTFEKSSNNVAVDADSLLFYTGCGNYNSFDEVLDSFLGRVAFIKERLNTNGEYFFFLSDSRENNFRRFIDKRYKEGRRAEKPVWVSKLRFYLQENYGNFYLCEGCEADDAVAYIKSQDKNIIIASPDKDVLNQISGKHYNYQKDCVVFTEPEDAQRFKWLQAIAGDSTDGIKGVPGVGMKLAEKKLVRSAYEDVYYKSALHLYKLAGLSKQFLLKNLRLVDLSQIADATFEKQKFIPKSFFIYNF